MGVRAVLTSLASRARARVFVLVGVGGRKWAETLPLDERLALLPSPRSANVLLVSGYLTEPLLPAALAAHDAMSRPRSVVQWLPRGGPDPIADLAFRDRAVVGSGEDVGDVLLARQGDLFAGRVESTPALLPDEDPAPWRGIGPYRQGGKGMSGGVPYGRPLPGRAPDRDGVELDQLTVTFGPAIPVLPPGLVLEARVQGDVIQEANVVGNAFEDGAALGRVPASSPFASALARPVPVSRLELARARHHLSWLSSIVRVHGPDALAVRILRIALDAKPQDADAVRSLGSFLTRTRTLDAATADIGILDADGAASAGGPVARAAGMATDARTSDPAYRELDFEPLTQRNGDARARWRQRLEEAVQSLDLAARAGDRTTEPRDEVESPRGVLAPDRVPSSAFLELLPRALAGQEWGDAVTVVESLDIDMEEAARAVVSPPLVEAVW